MDTVTCPMCDGEGELELTGVYHETLHAVRDICLSYEYVTAPQVAATFDCQPTAMNNRLVRLEEMGFLESERFGRERRYKLAED